MLVLRHLDLGLFHVHLELFLSLNASIFDVEMITRTSMTRKRIDNLLKTHNVNNVVPFIPFLEITLLEHESLFNQIERTTVFPCYNVQPNLFLIHTLLYPSLKPVLLSCRWSNPCCVFFVGLLGTMNQQNFPFSNRAILQLVV